MIVRFRPYETLRQVDLTICGDRLDETTETVGLGLTMAGSGNTNTAVLNINDTASQYQSTVPITIGSLPTADPYPSTISVKREPIITGSLRVTLYDYSHQSPDNVDIPLVSPRGQTFVVMSDAGGFAPGGVVTLTFQDQALAVLPDEGPLMTGKFEPTSWLVGIANFPAPAPAGPYNEPGSDLGAAGRQSFTGNFKGTDPNGIWRLYARSDGGGTGQIAGGWGIQFLGRSGPQFFGASGTDAH